MNTKIILILAHTSPSLWPHKADASRYYVHLRPPEDSSCQTCPCRVTEHTLQQQPTHTMTTFRNERKGIESIKQIQSFNRQFRTLNINNEIVKWRLVVFNSCQSTRGKMDVMRWTQNEHSFSKRKATFHKLYRNSN